MFRRMKVKTEYNQRDINAVVLDTLHTLLAEIRDIEHIYDIKPIAAGLAKTIAKTKMRAGL